MIRRTEEYPANDAIIKMKVPNNGMKLFDVPVNSKIDGK
jgi:hypothetical protein